MTSLKKDLTLIGATAAIALVMGFGALHSIRALAGDVELLETSTGDNARDWLPLIWCH